MVEEDICEEAGEKTREVNVDVIGEEVGAGADEGEESSEIADGDGDSLGGSEETGVIIAAVGIVGLGGLSRTGRRAFAA